MSEHMTSSIFDKWRKVASEAYAAWDSDHDMRVGKLLRAMADPAFAKVYRSEIAALHVDQEVRMEQLVCLAEIREAVGDPTAKLMQDELVERVRQLAKAASGQAQPAGMPDVKTEMDYEYDEEGLLDAYSEGHMEGWNACRDAMLAVDPAATATDDARDAEPTNSPENPDSSFSEEKLWAVHIVGPNDIVAAPSHHAAKWAAASLNKWAEANLRENFPVIRAQVIEYIGSADAHMRSVVNEFGEFIPLEGA